MIDFFSLAVSHGLLALAAIKLLKRPDLDRDTPAPAPARMGAPARRA